MTQKSIAGATVDVDAEGFLTHSEQWTQDLARALAQEAGVELGPAHWKVLEFARADYAQKGDSPGPRRIVAATGVSMKELYALFPKGPGKLVARLAGVPKPKACL